MKVYGLGNQQVTTPVQKTNDAMGVQDFLKIMTAQLQNLDPMGESGADSGEYIAQMAQFTMLEQLGAMGTSLDNITLLSQQQMSFAMVGKTVTVSDGTVETTGVVEKVRYRDGYAYPVIEGREYAMSMVTEVGEE